jgi:hypothetical protein
MEIGDGMVVWRETILTLNQEGALLVDSLSRLAFHDPPQISNAAGARQVSAP